MAQSQVAQIPSGVDPYLWHHAELLTVLQQIQAQGTAATAQQTALIATSLAAMKSVISPGPVAAAVVPIVTSV